MKYKSNSILAYISQNKEGELILKQSLLFQQALKQRIFVLDIIKSVSWLRQVFQTKKTKEHYKDSINELSNFVSDSIQKEITKEIIIRLKSGNILTTLIKESYEGGFEFIVINKSEGNFRGALSSNETNQFISKSHCPVLTLNKDFPLSNINTIVLPIDISQSTKKRLYWTTLFAKKFNAKIQIVSVLNIKIDPTKSLAFKKADKIKEMLLKRGVECDIEILSAQKQPKHKVLLEYLEKVKPELVIIRTHQEIQFSGKKIGKFVSDIVHGCKAPVFTVGGSTESHDVEFN